MYEWVLDDPENNELLMSFHEGYELTEPGGSSYYFRMNWGWGNYSGEDDAEYAPHGLWNNPNISGSHPYQYNIEMFYSFTD